MKQDFLEQKSYIHILETLSIFHHRVLGYLHAKLMEVDLELICCCFLYTVLKCIEITMKYYCFWIWKLKVYILYYRMELLDVLIEFLKNHDFGQCFNRFRELKLSIVQISLDRITS